MRSGRAWRTALLELVLVLSLISALALARGGLEADSRLPAARPSRGSNASRPRLVSLAPSLTEILFAVGAGDELAGVTTYCDFPPAARKLPRIGGIEDGSIDLERVLARRPDRVLSIGEGQERTVAALRRLGLKVEVIPSQTIEDVFQAVPRLGLLSGHPAEAERLALDLRRRFARVEALVSRLPAAARPRVFYELWDRPLMTATRSTLIGGLIERAGGNNIFATLPGRYPQVSVEAVLERNPQVILAPDQHGQPVDAAGLVERTGLGRVEAARRGRIVILEGDSVSRAGPRMADMLERIARELHPGLFPPTGRGGARR